MKKPRQKIDASQVEDLAFIGSPLSEMATFLNCSQDTLYRRFHKAIKRGIVCRTIFLRRQRFDLAMKGNAAALKWFWETSLGETNEQLKDLQRHEKEALNSLSTEELIERVKRAISDLERSAAKKTAAPTPPLTDADPGSARTHLPN